MNHEGYMELLKSKFQKHFTIETDIELFGNAIDMHASFSDVSGRTFITKNDIIDRYENHEYCYIKKYDDVTEEEINKYGLFLKKIVDECVTPGKDHMSTYVTGIIITRSMNESVRKTVENYSYSRAYSFYLRGWCDVRLILVALGSNEVITNKAGKKVKKIYQFKS